jgi:hypothetical protein
VTTTTPDKLPPAVAVPFTDEELSAHSDVLGPVARTYTAYATARSALPTLAATLERDRHLSPEGRTAKLTTDGLKPAVADLSAGLTGLDAAEARWRTALEARVTTLQAATALAPISDARRAELVAVAQAFRLLPREEQSRRKAAAQRDADPDRETLEMMQHISPTIWGGTTVMQELARGHGQPTIEDDAEVRRLVALLDKAATARAHLTARRHALVASGDYRLLQEAGLVAKRLRDMTAREKSEYIDRHGLAAFKALPA